MGKSIDYRIKHLLKEKSRLEEINKILRASLEKRKKFMAD
jgi:hypothetical protein